MDDPVGWVMDRAGVCCDVTQICSLGGDRCRTLREHLCTRRCRSLIADHQVD
jgi:hypothetical protein